MSGRLLELLSLSMKGQACSNSWDFTLTQRRLPGQGLTRKALRDQPAPASFLYPRGSGDQRGASLA